MPNRKPEKLLGEADALDDALGSLAETGGQLDRARDKLMKMEGQAADLIEQTLGDRAMRANSLSAALQHKYRAQRSIMQRLRRDFEQTADRYGRVLDGFRTALARHRQHEAEHLADTRALRRCAGALHRTLDGIVRARLRAGAADLPETGFRMPAESHGYIPFPVQRFFEVLMRLDSLLTTDPDYQADDTRHRPVSFVEVGCGSGRNILLARYAGLVLLERSCGFELNADLVEMGRRGLDLGDDIFVADALEFDYRGFDVLFSYRPIQMPSLQAQLEQRMVTTMRPGAYLIAPMAEDLDRYPDLTCVSRNMDIWKKTG